MMMCLPSNAPMQLGNCQHWLNSCSILIQSSLLGTGISSSARTSHRASQVSLTAWWIVATSHRHLLLRVWNESPVARKLKLEIIHILIHSFNPFSDHIIHFWHIIIHVMEYHNLFYVSDFINWIIMNLICFSTHALSSFSIDGCSKWIINLRGLIIQYPFTFLCY